MAGLAGAGKGRNRGSIPKFEELEIKSQDSTKSELDKFYTKPEKIPTVQRTIRIDEDVAAALDEFGRINGKGAKSGLINNMLKEVFNIRQGEK
ncbi:hypothetical protein PVN23_21770 [Bacillus licheniformis]|uniref:hypothetical protein n=1 Tax=Bacillus licheniformis TaxID=1402 RepID=UPI00237C5EE4|nr:hypothetical protein [Bacillus licheniformis]MDE1381225.1 hypothetical protein [Bacillus licheniformis]